jgi:hypothetical protein
MTRALIDFAIGGMGAVFVLAANDLLERYRRRRGGR